MLVAVTCGKGPGQPGKGQFGAINLGVIDQPFRFVGRVGQRANHRDAGQLPGNATHNIRVVQTGVDQVDFQRFHQLAQLTHAREPLSLTRHIQAVHRNIHGTEQGLQVVGRPEITDIVGETLPVQRPYFQGKLPFSAPSPT